MNFSLTMCSKTLGIVNSATFANYPIRRLSNESEEKNLSTSWMDSSLTMCIKTLGIVNKAAFVNYPIRRLSNESEEKNLTTSYVSTYRGWSNRCGKRGITF